jgi:hypothetical protein
MFKKYIEYYKDNPKGYWFKRKLYGCGWTPVKWQGLAVILIFIAFILWNGLSLSAVEEPTDSMLFWFFAKLIVSLVILLVICYKKGEKPCWQWGLPNKNDLK